MFYSIKGILEQTRADSVIIETPVFSYQVYIPGKSLTELPAVGENVKLYLSPVFREDDITLYGFVREQEKELFEMVMKVSGVGPKTALALLSELGADGLIRAVASGDAKTLTKAPGIGKKGAERILVELKDKFGKMSLTLPATDLPGPTDAIGKLQAEDRLFNEASEALMGLGFTFNEASRMISGAMEEGITLEDLIRKALSGGME